MNNGHSIGYFPLERRTRQGDPLSAYLFILALKIMFIQIRNNDQIKGLKLMIALSSSQLMLTTPILLHLMSHHFSRYSLFAIFLKNFHL